MKIIPKPNSIKLTGGYLVLDGYNFTNFFKNNDKFIREIFSEFLPFLENLPANINFLEEKGLKEEEYRLVIDDKITVYASTSKGSFYGLQSIKQLLIEYKNKLPKLEILDSPRFSYRSFMLDESRHFFGMDVVKETLDIMAMLKLNNFHWHLTDDQGWRVEIKKYPLLTSKGSIRQSSQKAILGQFFKNCLHDNVEYGKGLFYTQEQLKEIVLYAKERYIEICPEIDMPGHLTAAISCYPELSCFNENIDVSKYFGIHKVIGCAGKQQLYDFVEDVIYELKDIFTSGYFHIGGDEAPKEKWKQCPNCQRAIKEHDLKDEQALQGYFNNQIVSYLQGFNKRTIAWNEILKSGTVSDDTVVQYWTGNPDKNGVNNWLEKGNNIIISKCTRLYMDYPYPLEPIKYSYETDLESVGINPKYEGQVLGFEAPLWSEYVASKGKLEYQIYPRIMSLAEINWTDKSKKSYKDFEENLQNLYTYFDSKNIKYATIKASNPVGINRLCRIVSSSQTMLLCPDYEYEKYCKTTK